MGIKLFFLSTVPAVFGGLSGLLWGDVFLPRTPAAQPLVLPQSRLLWITAIILGCAFILTLGRGLEFNH